jgi:hypothetical protein
VVETCQAKSTSADIVRLLPDVARRTINPSCQAAHRNGSLGKVGSLRRLPVSLLCHSEQGRRRAAKRRQGVRIVIAWHYTTGCTCRLFGNPASCVRAACSSVPMSGPSCGFQRALLGADRGQDDPLDLDRGTVEKRRMAVSRSARPRCGKLARWVRVSAGSVHGSLVTLGSRRVTRSPITVAPLVVVN